MLEWVGDLSFLCQQKIPLILMHIIKDMFKMHAFKQQIARSACILD